MPRQSTRSFNVSALILSCAVGAIVASVAMGLTHHPVHTDDRSYILDDDPPELVLTADWTPTDADQSDVVLAGAVVVWRIAASAAPVSSAAGAGGQAALSAPVSGTADNPFANTCDGRAVGFITGSNELPRMDFRNVPVDAVLECRTGPPATVGAQSFGPCDGQNGAGRSYQPSFSAEGRHRTEVRYRVNGALSPTMQVSYYVHRSLDRVACCSTTTGDAAFFAAARAALPAVGPFDASIRLDNPVVTIPAGPANAPQNTRLLSLRRTFRLSDDRRLVLIRRTMASRRTFERTRTNSCVGVSLAVPRVSITATAAASCSETQEAPFNEGPVDSKCPGIYCTVTTCVATRPGCTQVTHTFNRGPRQTPWVKKMPEVCGKAAVVATTPQQCDAYVLNANGDGVCLASQGGQVRTVATITQPAAEGLSVLGRQNVPGTEKDHYVFSAKTTRRGATNTLYLPQ